jgi:flagellar hook-associated protein 2
LATTINASSLMSSGTSGSSGSSTTNSIDWNALIEVAVNAKLAKADSIDLKITNNEAKIASYKQMQSLLTTMSTAANSLRAPTGTLNKAADVFLSRAAYLTGNGVADPASSVSATVESGAEMGKFDLQIIALAKAHKIGSGAHASKADDLGFAGVFSLGTVAGDNADITVTADMSLAEIAAAINTQTTTTKVSASVVAVSASEYRLVLSSTETGQVIEASAVSGGDVLNQLGLTNGAGGIANELQASAQAQIRVDGILVTRASNDISDVVTGVTLHLYQPTPAATSVTVEVGTDLNAVKNAVLALAEAYNAYRDFAYAQQQLPNANNKETTVLFGDGTLRSANSAIDSALINSADANSLAMLGLTFDNTNHLVLDETVLDNTLLSNLEAVQSLLSFQMTSSSADLLLLSRGTEAVPDFTLDIVVDAGGVITSASVNGNSSLFTVSGSGIKGAVGSIYEGYTLVFVGDASQSVDVSFSSGIAERLYNAADAAANANKGALSIVVGALEDTNGDLKAKSDTIRTLTETYRTNLTTRYAKVQAAIAAAESSQEYLKNLMDTWNNPS